MPRPALLRLPLLCAALLWALGALGRALPVTEAGQQYDSIVRAAYNEGFIHSAAYCPGLRGPHIVAVTTAAGRTVRKIAF